MKTLLVGFLTTFGLLSATGRLHAQKAPDAGYIFPPGGKAGTTVDVRLGGYDWTPDMEVFSLDPRVKLTLSGPPGPVLIPPPPYWFGAKGRLAALPLARETPAKLVIPADVAAGPIYWQAANANGCTSVGSFIVGAGPEVVEDENRKAPQPLAGLPVTISGRLLKNEEVDRYRFTAPRDGPITCELLARRLGAKFHGVLEVRDAKDQMIADAAGTSGEDPILTFAAKAGVEYIIAVADIDFAGDRSYVYRLSITDGPRVLGAIPAAGLRGETREVELVGIGVATGAVKLESIKQKVVFPAAANIASFEYRLETPKGNAATFRLFVSDGPEIVSRFTTPIRTHQDALSGPIGVTGVLDQPDAEDRFTFVWKKGQVWSLTAEARKIGSPLDVALTILGPDGKMLARNDDLPETTDAGLEFTVPADGNYQVVVSDMAGKSGSLAAIYHLIARQPVLDFALRLAAQRANVQLGGKFDLTVNVIRKGGFQGPISLAVAGLPPGITAPANVVVPAGKNTLAISLTADKDASAVAGLVTVVGTANLTPPPASPKDVVKEGPSVTRTALAPIALSQAPRSPEENLVGAVLVASTMKPRFKGQPVDQDTGRKVHRGSTFPADIIVERLEGYTGDVFLQQASRQSYQVHGITGGEAKVPPGVTKAIYPCFMPEWLESTRTSRMGIIAVAQIADPKGKVRYLVNDITGFVTMTLEGALLKVSHEDHDLVAPAGQLFEVRLKISRLAKLAEPVKLELRLPEELVGKLKAETVIVAVGKEEAVFRVTPTADLAGIHTFTIRGTAMQDGQYPAISEAAVSVEFVRKK